MSPRRLHPAAVVGGLLTGALAVAIGVALLGRSDSAFGRVWAVGFALMGLLVLASAATGLVRRRPVTVTAHETTLDGEPARFHPRASTQRMLLLITTALGCWCAAVAVVGAATESWLWAIFVVPTLYLLGFPVLFATGRLRPGGVWVTPTRVVDEQLGLRSELARADVAAASPRPGGLRITPRTGASVTRRPTTPRPWRAGVAEPQVMVVRTDGLAGGGEALAEELGQRGSVR